MPARKDIRKILIIGSGPIIIGQACEFDYSGNQAVQALKEEGYEVILHNPNPATVMTIPGNAQSIYFDPLEIEYLCDILHREKPDAVLATMGGQTALNLAMEADKCGVFASSKVELIGATIQSIRVAEDRGLFKQKMHEIGLDSPISSLVKSVDEAYVVLKNTDFPVIVRPSFTLGGRGGGIARNEKEFLSLIESAFIASPSHTALVEESLIGYQEFEFEVMRDKNDNAVVVCSIENIDPMGVHTGDSITIAPIQTLSDSEYQTLRSAAIEILRVIGVDCGGSNVQFAYHPQTKRLLVIEMNPRVSRSSALASKATGFPIARCSAKLAVACTLDEVMNDITGKTTTFFEPALDYCAVKVPRFELQKFEAKQLGTQMISVGESLALGRTFPEALNKALRAVEIGVEGLDALENFSDDEVLTVVQTLHPKRIFGIYTMLLRAIASTQKLSDGTVSFSSHAAISSQIQCVQERIQDMTHFHPWVVHYITCIAQVEHALSYYVQLDDVPPSLLRKAKSMGFSDTKIVRCIMHNFADVGRRCQLCEETQASNDYNFAHLRSELRALKRKHNIAAAYHCVDTCAGEFEAKTPYFYSSFSTVDEHDASDSLEIASLHTREKELQKKIAIIGSGPNRIGQGLEFDTCCTMAAMSLRKRGIEVTMINSNPETVSTDFNISDRLYLEPLTSDDVYEVLQKAGIRDVICQLGGQTPITMAEDLTRRGIRIVGTDLNAIDTAEDRQCFSTMLAEIGLLQAPGKTVTNTQDILSVAKILGFPVLIRPSYVIGGQSMVVVYTEEELNAFVAKYCDELAQNTVLIDKFLEDATEYDVDIVSDGQSIYIGGVLQHIEHAGVHSGDSACVFENKVLKTPTAYAIYESACKIARTLNIRGLMNIQYAELDGKVYVIEVNPRASRTVPFISKISHVDMIQLAVDVWLGAKLKDMSVFQKHRLELHEASENEMCNFDLAVACSAEGWAVKEAVFSFDRFKNIDPALSPQMRSTGEVVGIGDTFGEAFAKASAASFCKLPLRGLVFISVADKHKPHIVLSMQKLIAMKFTLIGTYGTANYLQKHGIPCSVINRVANGSPHVLEKLNEIDLLINILESVDERSFRDDKEIRLAAVRAHIPYVTTLPAVKAVIEGIEHSILHKATAHAVLAKYSVE